jgi:hypothetical protein
MFPCLSSQNSLNISMRYGEHSSKLSAPVTLGSQISNRHYLRLFQLGSMYFITIQLRTMFAFIKAIIGWSVPTEIFQKTVGGDAVTVTGLHPLGTEADKGDEDKLVDSDHHAVALLTQLYIGVAILGFATSQYFSRIGVYHPSWFVSLACRRSLSPKRPNPAMGAGLITFKPRNRFPNLRGIVKLIFSHGAPLLIRVASGLEPPQGYSLVAA